MAKLKPIGHLTARQSAWQAIRTLSGRQEFTAADVVRVSRAGSHAVHEYLGLLVKAGILERAAGRREPMQRPSTYRLVRDTGVEAPRVRADGSIDDKPTGQERIWAAMKSLAEFGYQDLQLVTGLGRTTVKSYVLQLAKAGYLTNGSRRGVYRLRASKNTGPRPPAVRRGKAVFDLNLGREARP